MHHYERFMNHAKSRSLESKLHETCLSKMEAMQVRRRAVEGRCRGQAAWAS